MPKLYDEDGKEVAGALSADEVAAQVEAARKKAEEDAAAKLADKDKNFEALRTQKEQAETKAEEEKKAREAKETEYSAKEQERIQAERTKTVEALAKGDTALAEKIQFHLKRLEGEIKTPEDFQKVLSDAYTLAAGQPVPDALSSVISSAGASNKGGNGANKLPISQEAMPVAEKLGVTADDLKKYGDKI